MVLVKIAYYAAQILVSLIALFYFLATLYGLTKPGPTNKPREAAVMLVANGTALGLLYWAYQLGHQQGQWAAGIGMVLAAVLAFVVLFFGGMFAFGKIHWQ